MKRYLIFLIIALIAITAAGQTSDSGGIDTGNRTLPLFLGNESFVDGELKRESLNEHLKKIVKFPQESLKCYEQGTEVVEFVVTATGEPTAFKVLNSACPRMDREVVVALKATRGKWIPGTVDGNAVDMKQEVSVVFAINSYLQYLKQVQNFSRKGNQLLFEHNKPKKALKYYNYALHLMPQDESLLAARSLCRYAMGDLSGAESDWERLKVLTQRNSNISGIVRIADKASRLKGYEEMMMAINWKQQEIADQH